MLDCPSWPFAAVMSGIRGLSGTWAPPASPAAGHRFNEEGNLRISSRKDRLNGGCSYPRDSERVIIVASRLWSQRGD